MSITLPEDTPQVRGLTVSAEVCIVRTYEVVAIITADSRNQQLPRWFVNAATEVRPLRCQRMESCGRRQARVIVTISVKGFQSPEDAVVAYIKGTMRKVQARHAMKATAPQPTSEQRPARVRRTAGPSTRFAHRRFAFS